MNKAIYLPNGNNTNPSERIEVGHNVMLETTAGLAKETNEDSIGCFVDEKTIRICVADGHWGEEASRMIVRHWIDKDIEFPTTPETARQETRKIESEIYTKFGKPSMDENTDFTPEASFIFVEVSNGTATIVSYGDTRLLIANNGELTYQHPRNDTWIGAFSRLGLRERMPVENAVIFKKVPLIENDHIFLFSDGVDQCIYEKDTIRLVRIAELSKKPTLKVIFDTLFEEIFEHGAEDNASLAVIRY